MPAYDFVTVDVFTDRRFGGNPLAVFPDARGLTDAQMQAIAAEFNLSETTFVLPPDNPQHHARVRIFTPRTELPFAGHPNVGTGFVLARRDATRPSICMFEELAGLVRVHILRAAANAITGARISAPRSLSIDDRCPTDLVAACAGLHPSDIAHRAHTPLVASVGTPFVIAEVASVEALSRASPDLGAFRAAAERHRKSARDLRCISMRGVAGDDAAARSHVRAAGRRAGGSGHGQRQCDAGGAADFAGAGRERDLTYDIEQGQQMGRPSRILASARKTAKAR